MSQAWKALDLQGGGVQGANLLLLRLMKRRRIAYALWLIFPLGQHRTYLGHARGAWYYRLASLATLGALAAGWRLPALATLAGMAAWACYDLYWIDRRITAVNKRLRMQVYLRHGNGAPPGYTGKYNEDGEPLAAPPTSRAPSFAEQEALLRELAKAGSKRERESGAA